MRYYIFTFFYVLSFQFALAQQWSAMYPLSIPLEVREKEFRRGNIVPNHSFEKGIANKKDSIVKDFKLLGWEVIGDNVEWCDTNLISYTKEDVFNQEKAIKITRKRKDVKEIGNESEGVLSDFIEVIPANYEFFLHVKLKNIIPSNSRLNSKIGKDIDIHLEFYDKDKKRLSDGIYFEYYDKLVDNSFKGFAFSNFYVIEKFDWGKIRARTLNYPFSEGDLPDGCRYIRIFIGLATSGTMWVDDVEFRLSRWNFTPLERMDSLFQKEYSLTDLLVPTPQEIVPKEKINLKNKAITILLPENPERADYTAANLLQKHIKSLNAKNKIKIITNKRYTSTNNNELIIELNRSDFPKEEQAYQIRKEKNRIIFSGNTGLAHYYAATTFVQLLDKKEQTYHHTYIYDFPDFKGRSYVLTHIKNEWTLKNELKYDKNKIKQYLAEQNKRIEHEINSVERHSFYKLNKAYAEYTSLSKNWKNPGKEYYEFVDKITDKFLSTGVMKFSYMINPYRHFDYESQEETLSDSLRNYFSHSKKEDIEAIINIIKAGVNKGVVSSVMICADDFVPHKGKQRGVYTLFTKEDKQMYYNIAQAQIEMLKIIKQWLEEKDKTIRLEFCPAPYLNQFIDYSRGSAEAYFRDISSHLPKDIPVIWTGNTVRSLCYDDADIRRYTAHIQRKPMLWDNTIYAREIEGEYGGYPAHYPGKSVMNNLFEPYDIIVPKNIAEQLDEHIYLNGNAYTERYKIKFATFADFAWNTKKYNPDFSLYKVLIRKFGKENALKLLIFNDKYYKLVSLWAELRNKKEHNPTVKFTEKEKKQGQELITNLQEAFKDLKTITNKKLKKELKGQMEHKINRLNQLINQNVQQQKTGHRQT